MPKAVVLSDKARTAIGSIARHKIRFQTMKDEFAKANQCVVCPSCGTMVDKNAAYCSACGAKMAPDEEAGGGEDAPDTKDTDGLIPID